MEKVKTLHEVLVQCITEAAEACADVDLLDLVLKLLLGA